MSRPIVVTACVFGGLSSTHIHGTSVPVEEPSTASSPDSANSHSLPGSARGKQGTDNPELSRIHFPVLWLALTSLLRSLRPRLTISLSSKSFFGAHGGANELGMR